MTTLWTVERGIGSTPLTLPTFGFGAAHLGELYSLVAEEEARAILDAAWDQGVRYFDTAPWYGRGLSEHRVGGFLRAKGRDEFKLTTKVGRQLVRPRNPRDFDTSPWVGGLRFDVVWDYSYDGIMRSYAQSLQRLALDTVDALVIHDLDAAHHGETLPVREKELLDSGLRALEELKGRGDIGAYGMGVNSNACFDGVVSRIDLDFCLVAMPYTLLDHEDLDHGMANLANRGVSVIIGSPFASGILATGSGGGAHYGYATASPAVQSKVRAIEAVCQRHRVALPAAALQFVLAHPAVASVVPGAARAAEVRSNVASVRAPIPRSFWDDMKGEGMIAAAAPVPGDVEARAP